MKNVIALGSLIVSLIACTHDVDAPASVSVCDGIDSKRIAVNGIQGNGIQGNRIALNGASLVGVRVAGTPKVGAAITAVLDDGSSVDLAIASESDGLFEVTRDGINVCADDEKGLFVEGIWDASGARHDSDTLSTFACTTGAIGKCVLWGYDPAKVGAGMHQACTRMVRADYCGDGVSSTRNGTIIDVSDTRGVQTATNLPGFSFEAGWNENGATCVNHPRIAGVVPSCFRDLPACASASEAENRGATLMNASRPMCQ
jgi:hypothetical protein